jgi:uncharacterized protein YdeI (BOF family)
MFGLNSDPAIDASYTSIDYAWYFVNDNTLQIYESGAFIGSYGTYNTSTVLNITYDGYNIRYWKNGVIQRTVARTIGNPLYLDTSFATVGASLNSVGFGPMAEQGTQGFQGNQGLQGPQGFQGNQGFQGPQGQIATVQEDTTSVTLYPTMVTGIGNLTTARITSTKLYFNASTGQITATDFNSTSDQNLKTNIKPIESSLSKLLKLNGVTFDWKDTNKPAIGVIAQEVEKIFPELVSQNLDHKTVKYNGLIGVLIEAVKELHTKVENLEEIIANNLK